MKLYEQCKICNYSIPFSSENIHTYKCQVDMIVKDDEDIDCPNFQEQGVFDQALEE